MKRIFSAMVVPLLLLCLSPASQAVLVAHYEFDDSGSLGLDSAGGNNNGTQQGADSAFSSFSRLGTGALSLDGTGTGLQLANSADFQNLTSFTIAAFVRPDLNSATWGGGSVAVGRVFGSLGVDGPGGTPFGDGNGYGFGLLRSGAVSGLRYTSYLVTDYNLPAANLADPLQDDEWAHVAVTVTAGATATAEFFINGVSVGTATGGNPNPTTNPFHIGASGGSNSDSFAGLLDDLRVYDEVLDAATIAGLANPAGSGQQGLVFAVDRDSGNVTLTNDSAFSAQLRGYSLFSNAGRFQSDEWLSITDNYDQGNPGAIDPDDNWFVFSDVSTDLSEGTLGEVTLAGGQSVELGNVWRRGPFETGDIRAEVLLASGVTTPALVTFAGNGGEAFKLGDLDFDGDVDLNDYTIYNSGLFTSDIDSEATDPYLLGDLNGDGNNDFFDFLIFKNAFIADGGNPAALAFGAAVPEPATATLVLVALLGVAVTRPMRRVGVSLMVAATLVAASSAQASLIPVFEYSFPASYEAKSVSTTIVDLSGAGNNGTMDPSGNDGMVIDDRPAGFDSSLMSISGSNGAHGQTDGLGLLNNSIIDDFGGFVFDAWFNWEGQFTSVRKIIDYAGTEYLRTRAGNIEFGLSNGATVLSYAINPNQWYHVQGVFRTNSQTDVDGNLLGNAFLLVDGELVDSAYGITKTAFGDSLNRPIGINRWAGGQGDWNQGRIFNPAVYLSSIPVPEPSSIGLALLGVAGLVGLRLRRSAKVLGMAFAALACVVPIASAQFFPVFEYSFPDSYDSSVTAVVDLSTAGNNGTLDGTAALIDNRPAGFDASLMSLTGSNGGHGRTDAIDLLENATIDDFGGFVFDVWMQWEGTFTNVRKQLDYAGTEYIRTFGGNVQFGISNGATVLSHPINANQWYHVQGVFESGTNQTDVNGNLAGNAFLYVDGELVASAFNVSKTAFGDSLNRPIGINRWAGGGGDWNQGLIFNPAVYLGQADEPMRLEVNTTTGEVSLVHLPNSLLPDARNIDFYQISSASGALTPGTWSSLADSGFDGGSGGAGDYNGDGSVDSADYTVWRDTLGATGTGLAADGNGDGVVDNLDYNVWRSGFGTTGGGPAWAEAGILSDSLVGETFLTGSSLFDDGLSVSLGQLWNEASLADPTTDLVFQYHVEGEAGLRTGVIDIVSSGSLAGAAVPEPSALLLVLPAVGLLLVARRHHQLRSRLAAVVASVVVLVVMSAHGMAQDRVDRLYLFGESDGDGGVPGVFVVDSADQATYDEAFDSGNLSGTAHDLIAWQYDSVLGAATLAPAGQGPQFASVAGRPLAGNSTVGVRFDGVNDLLIGARLGMPQTSASSQTGNTVPPTSLSSGVGPFDYRGITHRGFQLWVNPDENNAVFGTANQAVVLDTSQHGVLISAAGTWMLRYAGVNVDSGVAVKTDATDGGWSHVMVVNPDAAPFSGGGRLYIDGVAVAARAGGYTPTNDFPLVIGASTGAFDPTAVPPAPVFAGGNANFFAGTVDDLSMFVLGETITGVDYGTFDLTTQNEFVSNALVGYGPADLTGDGITNMADVTAFIANFGAVNLVSGLRVGDLNTRFAGDFNFDGGIDLDDWQILTDNYTGPGSLNLQDLLAGQAVPEPASIALAIVAGVALVGLRRRK